MDNELSVGEAGQAAPPRGDLLFVPAKVGNATVFVEARGPVAVEPNEDIYVAASIDPRQVFDAAGDIIRECVRVVGERVEKLTEAMRPNELSVEFSLSFEAEGRATLIPVFLTGKTSAQGGLTVTAVWKRT
jgi:NTP-dependent ternary system trypsin peptidase co-occuring protein